MVDVACEAIEVVRRPSEAGKPKGWKGDPYQLIRSMLAKGDRLADCFVYGGRLSRSAAKWSRVRGTGVVFAVGVCPKWCGERLLSPSWGEVIVSRSGGTTIESGVPSSGRDAALNVARPGWRHRRLHRRRQQSGHRTELNGGTGRPVWRPRAGGCLSGTGHGGEVRALRWANDVAVARHRASFVVVRRGERGLQTAELGPATRISLSDVSGRDGVDGHFRDAIQTEGLFDG
jgi:hypothetical protein